MEAIRVTDIMDHQPVMLGGLTTATQAMDEFFVRYGASWLPVVDDSGHYLGISQREAVQQATEAGEGWLTVASILEAEDGDSRVSEDRPLTELLSIPALGRLGGVVAVDGDDVVRGVVTLDQVKRALTNLFPQKRGS
jgi:CBS domain-containing protein